MIIPIFYDTLFCLSLYHDLYDPPSPSIFLSLSLSLSLSLCYCTRMDISSQQLIPNAELGLFGADNVQI